MSYLDKLFNLEGRVAVITGGGGAIASNMAEGFVKSGAKVVLLDLRKEATDEVVAKLSEFGTVVGKAVNVLEEGVLKSVLAEIIEEFGKVDVLINAAGGNMPGATIGPDQTIFDLDMEAFSKVTTLNLDGSVLPSLIFGEQMAKQGTGNIINISSMAADRVLTRVVGYSASKAAITNFTKWMSVEMAQKFEGNIRVNAIAPGFFVGEQNRALMLNEDGSLTERGNQIISNTPMGRFGDLSETVGAALFLVSDAAKFITGTVVPVDGGFSAYSGV
ncbi:MAG: SDR family oxidoreductase [Bacteroidota bacterium]